MKLSFTEFKNEVKERYGEKLFREWLHGTVVETKEMEESRGSRGKGTKKFRSANTFSSEEREEYSEWMGRTLGFTLSRRQTSAIKAMIKGKNVTMISENPLTYIIGE